MTKHVIAIDFNYDHWIAKLISRCLKRINQGLHKFVDITYVLHNINFKWWSSFIFTSVVVDNHNPLPYSLLTMKQKCTGCNRLIHDKFLLKVADDLWHEDCLRCYTCSQPLSKSCYIKDHKLYCKEDYDK